MNVRDAGGAQRRTSIAGVGAFPSCPAYCASKAGLENLTKALAAELGRLNVTVNSLAPGNVATPLNVHLRGPGHEEYIRMMRTMTPTGRDFLSVDEMTGAAAFLASDDASAIHRATLMVDACRSARWTDPAARPLAPTMSGLRVVIQGSMKRAGRGGLHRIPRT